MQPLARVAKNSYVTVAPQQSPPACGSSQFRWWFHIALPFTLPSRRCVQQTVELEGTSYNFSIHNHLDRFVQFPDAQPTWPSVHLISRSDQLPQPKPGWRHVRETLQSVACFEEVTDYIQPDLAYADAGEKVRVAFAFLSEHLAMLQRQMPYLTSWQLYPISQFEVGLVYHGLRHFCPRTNRWEYLATGVTINLARQLHQPLCLVEFQGTPVTTSAADLSNELLAEAQVALSRGLSRPAVINSYQAVESLANAVYKAKQTACLIGAGKAQPEAEAKADQLRKENRTKIKVLVHSGLFDACARSLLKEDAKKYNDLCQLQEMRNQVAHAGFKPSAEEAEASYLLCCEVIRWLCEVGGYPVRPLLPEEDALNPGLVSIPSDLNVPSGTGQAFLLWVLGASPKQELFEEPCKFTFQLNLPKVSRPK